MFCDGIQGYFVNSDGIATACLDKGGNIGYNRDSNDRIPAPEGEEKEYPFMKKNRRLLSALLLAGGLSLTALLGACTADPSEGIPETTAPVSDPVETPAETHPETPAETIPETGGVLPPDTVKETISETLPPDTAPETLPPFEPVALRDAVNVAREGYAVASSAKFDGGYSNLYLNDGDLTRGFTTAWGQGNDPAASHYILVDLASTQTVEAVNLHPLAGDEAGFPVDFDILVSTDNQTYTTVATVEGACYDSEGFTLSFDPVEASYVKLVTRKSGVGEGERGAYVALAEMEVLAAADTSANMILNRHDIWLFKNPDTTQQLAVLYYRDGTPVDPSVKLHFESADPAVAAVDENGLITPVALGETDIYVRDGRNRAVCHVEVKEEVALDYRVTAFYHSTFGTPETYVTGLQIIKDTGVEYIEDTRFRDAVGNNITMYMIYLCDKLGLAYSVCDQEGGEGGFLEMTEEEIIAIVQKYENRAGVFGLYLRDEPHEEYTQYAEVHRLIQEYNPHLTPHLNLLPPYNFGGTEEHYTEYAAVAGGARRMQFLSFDHYPFTWGGGFNAQIYQSINMVREAGLRYNADTGYYLQSMIITDAYPLLYERELRYNASLGMAYGMKNFKWFVALCPIGVEGEPFESGIVKPDFTPADNHADLTATNAYIKNLGRYLGDSDAIEVYHTSNDHGAVMLPDTFLLQPAKNQSSIYTLYRANDGSGRQHILVTNKNYRATKAVTLSLRLTTDIGAISLYDPLTDTETALTVAADGTFSVSLEPGACALILLPEGVDASAPARESDNLALDKAVFASSSDAKFWEDGNIGTHFLTDGERGNGYWISDSKDRDAYLLVDLGAVETFSKIHLYNHSALANRFCAKFTVSVSADGINYTDVATLTDGKPADMDTPTEVTFDAVSARYIRIKVDQTRPGLGFGEIEVYA